MKPGNLSEEEKVPNPAAIRKMRIRFFAHIESSMCVFAYYDALKGTFPNGKKTLYF